MKFEQKNLDLYESIYESAKQKAFEWIRNLPISNPDKDLTNDPDYLKYCTDRFGYMPKDVVLANFESYLSDEMNSNFFDDKTKIALHDIYLHINKNKKRK